MTATGAETTLNLPPCPEIGNRAVEAIHAAYDRYHRGFEEITRRARERFEQRDWLGAQADATGRLALYRTHVDAAVAKAYGGKRRIAWLEVLAGEKAFNQTKEWMPGETLDAFRKYLVGIKGPLSTPVGADRVAGTHGRPQRPLHD